MAAICCVAADHQLQCLLSPLANPEKNKSPVLTHLSMLVETAIGIPFVPGNRVKVLRNGDEIFPAMLGAINRSERSIDFVTHVYWTGDIAVKFAQALAQRAQSGVTVRLLLDAFGCHSIDDELIDLMQNAGVEVRWFRPFSQWKVWKWDNRTHRKIVVCDHDIAFTGGVGIAKEWEGDARNPSEWRETHFQITGPIVNAIRSGFLSNWSETLVTGVPEIDHPVRPAQDGSASIQAVSSPSSINWSDIAMLFRVLIKNANSKIDITTAYFVPDETLLTQLREACKRGVEIRLLLPGQHTDQRLSQLGGEDHFKALLEAGVKIFQYQRTMLHAKLMVVDDSVAVVGSANMNHRSMAKDEEFCLVIEDATTIVELNQHFDEDLQHSEALDMENWRKRSVWQRAGEMFSRVTRAEL